jgi:predicted alpha/beta-fold hydrolase
MPVIRSQFHPHLWLRHAHLQTLLSVISMRKRRLPYQRERLELSDGDFLDLDWLPGLGSDLAILSHGLEGSSQDVTICGMAAALQRNGWNVLAWNYRGCSEELNRLPRLYHSGETADLALVIEHAARRFARIALIGFSLGGNLVLKYLGEARPHSAIAGAVAISAPIDLAASARALDQRRTNRLYLRRLIATLVRKVKAKAKHFPEQIDASRTRGIHGFEDFDGRFTAPVHGFRDASDYWLRCSSRQFLQTITVPVLILSAQDDPFLTPACFPFEEAEASACVFLEAPATGGHLGFCSSLWSEQSWAEGRTVEFLSEWCRAAGPPFARASSR